MTIPCATCEHANKKDAFFCEICGAALHPASRVNKQAFQDVDEKNFRVGSLISNRFLIVEEISRNTFGYIFHVQDTHANDYPYILKLLHPNLSDDEEARTRFREEIDVCIDPVHKPEILSDRLPSGQDIYFSLTGQSLEKHLQLRAGKVPPFQLVEIRKVMRSLLTTLEHAHQFTIHNHISPETIIVMGEFPNISIRLTGFGIAEPLLASSLNGAGSHTRSLVYMAPEQVQTPLASDLRADLFSVGMILYEMVTGEKAVGAFIMPSEYLSDAYKPLDAVLKKVLSPDVDRRHSSATELSMDISTALNKVMAAEAKTYLTQSVKMDSQHPAPEPVKKKVQSNISSGLSGSRNPIFFLVLLLLLLTGGYFLWSQSTLSRHQGQGTYEDPSKIFKNIKPTDTRKASAEDPLDDLQPDEQTLHLPAGATGQ